MKANIRTLAAILLCGITLASCNHNDDDNAPAPKSYTLTIAASKGGSHSLSKALKLSSEGGVSATWTKGDEVRVYDNFTLLGTLTAQSTGEETILEGELDDVRQNLLLIYQDETDYGNQDGTLEYISANLDQASATVTVKDVTESGQIIINEPYADFTNDQAIVKFTLKSGENNVKATSLQISPGDYTITPKEPTNVFYVAIKEYGAFNISLKASTESGDTYIFSKKNVNFAYGNYYEVTVENMAKEIVDLSTLTGDYFVAPDKIVLTGELSGNCAISISDGATVTLNNVKIVGEHNNSYQWAGITCEGDATIILEGDNTVKGFYEDYPGIYIAENHTLTIDGTGTLKASSNGYGAGIGGGYGKSCGNIIINGGTITATGGDYAGGIGSGRGSSCGNITISGGTVTATGEKEGAGIGSGFDQSCGNITISGGTVTATGGVKGAGIGSGYGDEDAPSTCGNITISGGTVTATGGEDAVGIGSGYLKSTCGDIKITAGVEQVIATKGQNAPNSIGAGDQSTCGTVTIEEGANVIQN